MKDSYTQAVIDLIETGESPASVLKGLHKTLKTHGHEALLSGVLRSVLRRLEAKPLKQSVLVVANQTELHKHKASIKQALEELSLREDDTLVSVDDTLIGGFVLKSTNTIVDHSYKHKLVALYRKLTT